MWLSFHGYSQKPTLEWNIEWNISPTHYIVSRLQNISPPPSTGKYLSGLENTRSHTSQPRSRSSCKWWIGRRLYLSKQSSRKWTGETKEISTHFIEMFWRKDDCKKREMKKDPWRGEKLISQMRPPAGKETISHDLHCQKCSYELTLETVAVSIWQTSQI